MLIVSCLMMSNIEDESGARGDDSVHNGKFVVRYLAAIETLPQHLVYFYL
jgi:hypothetical protein